MFRLILFFTFFTTSLSISQELACTVTVDARQTGNENLQIFNSLQNQLTEFINNSKWTSRKIRNNERVECNMFINISSYDNDVFQGTLQIQSSRPIYNSSYNSPAYNFNDKNFTFRYQEFQNIRFNPEVFESNLVSVIAFHVYMILGTDADTFEPNSGDLFYNQAQKILDFSQQNGYKGWAPNDGLQSRYYLIDNILSPTYKEYRTVLYNYHYKGLDFMSTDLKQAKNNIAKSLMLLDQMNKRRPNSFILRVFFDAKSNEIQDVFSGGPSIPVTNLISTLSKIAPNHSDKWRKISF
jgi:hypothetical protein